MTESFRCSDAARERGDPVLGTAPPQPRLLLVEVPGGWPADAIAALPAEVRDDLVRVMTTGSARLLLVRRPGGQHRPEGPWQWYAVDPAASPGARVVGGTWSTGAELLAAATSALAGAAAQGPGVVDEQLLLVCTHGRKDVCCAVRGRPVAAALGEIWPAEVWECSHTGGDRFAANLLVLPDGACYGGLDADEVAGVVRGHRAGTPAVDHLRGRIGQDRRVQGAVVAALGRWAVPWDAVRPVGAPQVLPPAEGDGALAGTEDVVARWRTDVAVEGHGLWRASGVERLAPAQRLTCRAVQAGSVRVPEVVGWSALPEAVRGSAASEAVPGSAAPGSVPPDLR
ncbi:sucrase ferredoxin [uncultured Serinicoccus sp.]|uniref:sucrase ferredoxin n=1 Tax=uncultured Serinicoccus sp. TaxID=735514 RepID=UPI002635F233|nr:sucrase ferredoxin [uncultured Serinicoccus sp.]